MISFIPANDYCDNIFDGTHETPKPTCDGHPLITSKNILNGRLNLNDVYNISEFDYKNIQKRSAVKQWDILFSMIGSVGEIYLEKSSNIPYAIKNIGVFSCNQDEKAKWLYYYFKSPIAKQLIQNQKNGAVQKFLSLGALRKFPVIPYRHEYKGLLQILSALDAKIELNNQINAELEKMAKTLYDYWFVQFDFPDANGKPYKSSGGAMVWNEELKREIPEGWEVKNLFYVMDVQYGFPFDTSKFTDDASQKPVVRIRDILENTISTYSIENVQEKYKLISKDLLIGMDGNFHLNFWDKDGAYLNQRSVRIRSRKDSEVSNFQALFELTPYIKAREKNVSRTTVGHLSDKDLKRLFIVSAKSTTNFKPKKTFDAMLEKIITNRIENQTLVELRDWLLPMLMNGQVKVG